MAQAQRALALWCLKFFLNWVRTIFFYGTLHSPSLLRHTKTSRFLSLDQVPCNSKTLICRWQAPANSLESTAPGKTSLGRERSNPLLCHSAGIYWGKELRTAWSGTTGAQLLLHLILHFGTQFWYEAHLDEILLTVTSPTLSCSQRVDREDVPLGKTSLL